VWSARGRLLSTGRYFNDVVTTRTGNDAITMFKEQIHTLLNMIDLSLPSYYLGIEVEQKDGNIMLC
jgi:hypothetical protein